MIYFTVYLVEFLALDYVNMRVRDIQNMRVRDIQNSASAMSHSLRRIKPQSHVEKVVTLRVS